MPVAIPRPLGSKMREALPERAENLPEEAVAVVQEHRLVHEVQVERAGLLRLLGRRRMTARRRARSGNTSSATRRHRRKRSRRAAGRSAATMSRSMSESGRASPLAHDPNRTTLNTVAPQEVVSARTNSGSPLGRVPFDARMGEMYYGSVRRLARP
jgi:hypothetical protein